MFLSQTHRLWSQFSLLSFSPRLLSFFLPLFLSLSLLQFNFVGKLLGPRGNSLKRLQEDTLTKMSILGKGSMRDKEKVTLKCGVSFLLWLFHLYISFRALLPTLTKIWRWDDFMLLTCFSSRVFFLLSSKIKAFQHSFFWRYHACLPFWNYTVKHQVMNSKRLDFVLFPVKNRSLGKDCCS